MPLGHPALVPQVMFTNAINPTAYIPFFDIGATNNVSSQPAPNNIGVPPPPHLENVFLGND